MSTVIVTLVQVPGLVKRTLETRSTPFGKELVITEGKEDMTGILEQIVAQNNEIISLLRSGSGQAGNPAQQSNAALAQQQQYPVQQQQLVQQQPVQQQQQGQVTAEMVSALAQALVENPQAKAALQAHMHGMGIPGLAETKPEQFTELYCRFKNVEAQVNGWQLPYPQYAQPGGAPQQQVQQFQQPVQQQQPVQPAPII